MRSLAVALLLCGLSLPYFIHVYADPIPAEALESTEEDENLQAEDRSFFNPFVIGETILDIQCRRGFVTVCAPDGPNACPIAYSFQTNVGVCGLATLNHYLNTSNIAGTCCYKRPGAGLIGQTTSTTISPAVVPQIIAYPVYAQYPFAVGGAPSSSYAAAPASSYAAAPSYGAAPSGYSG